MENQENTQKDWTQKNKKTLEKLEDLTKKVETSLEGLTRRNKN